jgi:hypothetical protein
LFVNRQWPINGPFRVKGRSSDVSSGVTDDLKAFHCSGRSFHWPQVSECALVKSNKQQHYSQARKQSKKKAEPPHRPHVSNAAHACTLKDTHCDA